MNKVISRAFLGALVIVAYFSCLKWWIGTYGWTGPNDSRLLLSQIILLCLMGLFVLLRPILLFFKGQKKEALYLFVGTIGFIGALSLIVILSVKMYDWYLDVTFPTTGQSCGGFINNPGICPTDFHCRYRPNSPSDAGGICVLN